MHFVHNIKMESEVPCESSGFGTVNQCLNYYNFHNAYLKSCPFNELEYPIQEQVNREQCDGFNPFQHNYQDYYCVQRNHEYLLAKDDDTRCVGFWNSDLRMLNQQLYQNTDQDWTARIDSNYCFNETDGFHQNEAFNESYIEESLEVNSPCSDDSTGRNFII